jgi:Zn-dependent M28 family amino/carboxypeptidase
MRSAGTDSHRNPHTGITRFEEGLTPIPAAALGAPDAAQLARLIALGKPVRVRVALDCGWTGTATSYNVIGEMRGRSKPDEVVLIGGHLDSWDLGTGAIDDGAGVAIAMGAGKLIGDMKQRPARTIRVVAFANEEQGLHGGRAYLAKHVADVRKHQIAAESDFGAGRIYAFSSGAPDYAKDAVKQIADVLAPLGIAFTPGEGGPGPDIGPFAGEGMAWAALRQDGTDYFDYHHTPDDTLDKIDPKALAQNVAAYAVFAYLAADAKGDFGSKPGKVTPPKE